MGGWPAAFSPCIWSPLLKAVPACSAGDCAPECIREPPAAGANMPLPPLAVCQAPLGPRLGHAIGAPSQDANTGCFCLGDSPAFPNLPWPVHNFCLLGWGCPESGGFRVQRRALDVQKSIARTQLQNIWQQESTLLLHLDKIEVLTTSTISTLGREIVTTHVLSQIVSAEWIDGSNRSIHSIDFEWIESRFWG